MTTTTNRYEHLEATMLALSERQLEEVGRRMYVLAAEADPGLVTDLFAALALVVIESAEGRARLLEELDPDRDEIGALVTDPGELAALEEVFAQAENERLAGELKSLGEEEAGPC